MAGSKRRQRSDTPTRRLNVQLDPEAHQRLLLHCLMTHQNPGELLSQFVNKHLRDWKVQKNASTRGTSTESAENAGQESESVPAVAA